MITQSNSLGGYEVTIEANQKDNMTEVQVNFTERMSTKLLEDLHVQEVMCEVAVYAYPSLWSPTAESTAYTCSNTQNNTVTKMNNTQNFAK